jgi:hypothetical protein
MNGSRTSYSSSSLRKNAHTCRVSQRCEPARTMGGVPFLRVHSSGVCSAGHERVDDRARLGEVGEVG